MPEQYRLRSDALEWREVEGEIVAADLRSSQYLAVNRTGAVLWPALAEGASEGALIERLVEAYGLDRAHAAHDVAQFLDALRRHGLLTT
jgi:Coenzyme PQQ synthesis protein D (PqqD)